MSLQRCEGSNLESVLEEVRNRFGDTVTIVEANRLRKGGIGGFFARERFEVVVDPDDGSADDEVPAPTEIPAAFGLEATEDFCERLLSMADDVSDLDGASPAPAPPAAPAPTTSISTEQPQFSAVLDSITRHMDTEAVPAAVPAPLPAAVTPPAPAPAPIQPAVDARALARLGLPEEIRRAALSAPVPTGGDPSAWLLGVLQDLPTADRLPQGAGSVIVVAGGREAALHLARQIATDLGVDPDGLLIASPVYRGRAVPAERRITAAEAAAEARRSWRRRPGPTVVAVDAPMGRSGEWARRVIDSLEPTMVWGAVDATRKPEDLFEWAERLGGFDALGVTGVENTVSPATVLQCGIPVGRLEGRPATPLLWASLLAPRLAA